MKVCLEQFPLGTITGQKTEGFYMDKTLCSNLDILAKAISKDMFFTILISGHGRVRVGKSVFAQQIGAYLTNKVNELYNIKNTFTIGNIHFDSKDLMRYSVIHPKYSVNIMDEGDDLTDNYWSSLSKDLRRFFRKTGQLNQFFILVIPDFFELSRAFAITHSICLIDVHFAGEFERGFFNFYSFSKKRFLFEEGKKKYGSYDVVYPNFRGRFPHVYTIDEHLYRMKKRQDLEKNIKLQEEKDDKKNLNLNKRKIKKELVKEFLDNLNKEGIKLTQEQKTKIFDYGNKAIVSINKEMDIMNIN